MVSNELRLQMLQMAQHAQSHEAIAARLNLDVETVGGVFEAGFADLIADLMEPFNDYLAFVGESSRIRPRLPETTAAFQEVVSAVYVPLLKGAHYRKVRLVWHRPGTKVWPVVDIQRGRSDGDFLSFTTNWGIHVPGYVPLRYAGQKDTVSCSMAPLAGRIGEFAPNGEDHWWSVGLGQLRRSFPRADPEDIHGEIRYLLSEGILPFLHRFTTITSLIEYIEELQELGEQPQHRRPGAQWTNSQAPGALPVLRRLASGD